MQPLNQTLNQPLPRTISFILFLALCASLAYWAIEFFTPSSRPVATSSHVAQPLPPVSDAADLFGGKADANTMKNIQLRGVILSGRAQESVAILVPDGGTPKYLRRDAEVMPGVKVQKIEAKKVVLSDHGVSREVSLAVFAPVSAMVAAPVNTNAMPASAVPQATSNPTETGISAAQNGNAAGSSGSAAATVTGNSNRPSAPANNAAISPQIAPQNTPPHLQQPPPRQSQDVTGIRAE